MTGVPRPVDLGWVSRDGQAPKPFLVATGMGHDAETLLEVRDSLKKRLGWVAYAQAGLETSRR